MKDTDHSHREISHRSPFSVRIRLSPPFPWRTSRGSTGLQIETVISNIKSYPDSFLEVAGTGFLEVAGTGSNSTLQVHNKVGA
jgi:hypothetical protein